MTGIIDVDRLYSVGVVVRDLAAATRRYAEIFGIDEWEVREFGDDRLSDVRSYGRPVAPTFRTATGVTKPPAGQQANILGAPVVPVTFELIQPVRGETPFQEFRYRRGQGISHITLAVRNENEFDVLKKDLAAHGIRVAASMTVDGSVRRHFIDTRKALGGFMVEVQVPLSATGQAVEVSERWNHADRYTRPEGVGPLEVQGVNHFGVVVDDVIESLGKFNEVLGVESFTIKDWRSESGLLENSFYRGEPVRHEYFTGLTAFKDFGFEVIQPTFGPSHYNREFRDVSGPGIHHMLLNATGSVEEWEATQKWLASIEVPLVMGADLFGGAGAFCYYDSFDALGGYIVEAVLLRGVPSEEARTPDYIVDFTALTSAL